jgi:alkanesulfonate monooxygenase SsuD/methylene tetrahydromethanopterin reductase-like flavin-dependent oxidoreductase (luciferase family)
MRLMTYLAVVPYRNPLLNAKSMTALDVRRGRATFVLGTGYLRSEFAALASTSTSATSSSTRRSR